MSEVSIPSDKNKSVVSGILPNGSILRLVEIQSAHLLRIGVKVGKELAELVADALIKEEFHPS